MDELRKKADEYLKNSDKDNSELTKLEMQKLIEELRVHQIELQIQNDELREKQVQIEEGKTKYFNLFQNAPVGYLVVDEKGIVCEMNLKACEIFEIRKGSVPGKPIVSLFKNISMSEFYERLEIVKRKQIPQICELFLQDNKAEKCIEMTISKYYENFYLVIINGITSRKEAEAKIKEQNDELMRLNEDKDMFMRVIAHDLRSPFNTIIGFSDLLAENYQNYETKKLGQMLKAINITSWNVYSLLEDLLLWSQSQGGKLPFLPQNLSFTEVWNSIESHLKVKAKDKDIQIISDENEPIELYADKNMLKTILRNLISNAIKFTGNNGKIIIRAKKTKKIAQIEVEDNGIGMTQETILKLWKNSKPFSTPGTNNEKGTGLGLLLCKEFVEKHGGKIWVDSRPGKGCLFCFSIPLTME